jgi:hypothetical protein
MTPQEMAARILAAYRQLATGLGDFVTIADLTDAAGVPVDVLAETLIRMYKDQQVNLIPRANQEVLTDRERQAAIWCGGKWKHLVSMREAR